MATERLLNKGIAWGRSLLLAWMVCLSVGSPGNSPLYPLQNTFIIHPTALVRSLYTMAIDPVLSDGGRGVVR